MSLKKVMEEIERFTESTTPEVMAIVGDWGVGKTYTWKAALLKAKNDNKISNKNYSYVSLFGINDINRLRFSIFENMVGRKHIGEEPNFSTLRDNLLNLNDSDIKEAECTFIQTLKRWFSTPKQTYLSVLKAIKNFFSDPWKRICTFFTHCEYFWRKTLRFFFPALQPMNETIHTLSYASVNETLICFDDLERTSLDLKYLLGVISELNEQKNCKVVLIYNYDKVKDVAELDIHNEKVIDISLKFDISADEAFSLVFDSNSDEYQTLRDFVFRLGIRNIRILEKISRFYALISPHINNYEPTLKTDIQRSVVLFTYACFESDEKKVPTLDYIAGYGLHSYLEKKDDTKQSWSNILEDYGYTFTDELDVLLIEAVKNGYVDSDNFRKLAEEKNESIKASVKVQSFTDAWKLYDNDLDIDLDDFVDKLVTSFNENIDQLSPMDLDQTVTILRELDPDKDVNTMISEYVELRRNDTSFFDPHHNYTLNRISDGGVKEAFQEHYKNDSSKETAEEVLSRIAFSSGWNSRDEIVLLNTSQEEFRRIFKNQKEYLSNYINAGLRFGRAENASSDQKKISDVVRGALTEIAQEGPLNEIRMRKYGIILDKDGSGE